MDPEGINSFEVRCLRWARIFLVADIAGGFLALFGGLLVAGGVWLVPGPTHPAAVPRFEPQKYELGMAERWAAGHKEQEHGIDQAMLAVDDPGHLPDRLASLFPTPPYPANDVWETYCKVPTEYGCLEKGKRLTAPKPSRIFALLFQKADENPQDELVGVLAEQLPHVAIEQRVHMVAPILMSYVALKKENDEGATAQEARAKEVAAQYEAAVESHKASDLGICFGALYVALWGLAAVLGSAVFVALLAIERHLRAMSRISVRLPGSTLTEGP